MFCNHCGKQEKDGQRFCTACGNEMTKPERRCCEICGQEVAEGACFCDVCGAPIKGASAPAVRSYCGYCGEHFEDEHQYCKSCGKPVRGERGAFLKGIKQILPERTAAAPAELTATPSAVLLQRCYIVLIALFALVAILWFVPAFRMEVPMLSWFSNDDDALHMSMGAPLADDELVDMLVSYGDISKSDMSTIKLLTGLGTFMYWVVPCMLCVLFLVLPLYKGTYRQYRRLVLQKIACIGWLMLFIINVISYNVVLSESSADDFATFGVTFGGVMLVLSLIGTLAVLFLTSYWSKRCAAEEA